MHANIIPIDSYTFSNRRIYEPDMYAGARTLAHFSSVGRRRTAAAGRLMMASLPPGAKITSRRASFAETVDTAFTIAAAQATPTIYGYGMYRQLIGLESRCYGSCMYRCPYAMRHGDTYMLTVSQCREVGLWIVVV